MAEGKEGCPCCWEEMCEEGVLLAPLPFLASVFGSEPLPLWTEVELLASVACELLSLFDACFEEDDDVADVC